MHAHPSSRARWVNFGFVAFHLGLQCLQKYKFRGFQSTKG